MTTVLVYILVGLAGLLVLFVVVGFVTLIVAGALETVPVCSFPEQRAIALDVQRSPYYAISNATAARRGLLDCGERPFVRGGGLGRLWLTPDRTTLVCVATVRRFRLQNDAMQLISISAGRPVIFTTDIALPSISRFEEAQALLNADLDELLDLHTRRCIGLSVTEFADAWRAYKTYERDYAASMVAEGLARYADGAQTIWRSTVKRSFLIACGVIWQPLTMQAEQAKRVSIKRPGHPGYVSSIERAAAAAAAAAQQQRQYDELEAELDDEEERC